MHGLIFGLVRFLSIVTAFNVRMKRDHHPGDDHLSYESVKKLMAQLEQDIKLHLDGDDVNINTTTTASLRATSPSVHNAGDITLRLYPAGMSYALEQVMLVIRHDAMRHRPQTFRTTYHGMDIIVDSIQTVDFLVPKLEIERLGETKFRFFTHGGGIRYLGLYSTIYKTTREGQFEALLDDIRVQLDVEFNDDDERITVTEKKCNARLEEVLVQLTPSMPSQIVNLLSEQIQIRFKEMVCPAFAHYVEKVANIAKSLAFIEDFTAEKDVPNPPCLTEHDRVAARLDSRGAKISFKRTNPREKRSATSNSVVEHEMLHDVTESGNIIFHLHRIPEIESVLRTNCDDTNCIGMFVDLDRVKDGSANLESYVTSIPQVEIHNGEAILHLSLNSVLSYENRAAHHRIPYLRFKTVMSARLTELNVDVSDNGYYKWTARYEITDLKTTNVHTDFENMKGIAKHLEKHLDVHRNEIEDLLTVHLNGDLPLRLNPHVHLLPESAVFGHHRVTIPLNFKLDKKLLPAFQFVHTSFV